MRGPMLSLVAFLCAACAAPPATTVTSPAPVAARAPAHAAIASPAVAPVATAASNQPQQAAGPKIPAGYKAQTRNGVTVYCTKHAQLGTRFVTETCMTADQIAAQEVQSERDRDQLRKGQTICGSGCSETR